MPDPIRPGYLPLSVPVRRPASGHSACLNSACPAALWPARTELVTPANLTGRNTSGSGYRATSSDGNPSSLTDVLRFIPVKGASAPGHIHETQNLRHFVQVEVVTFRLDLHRINNRLA